MQLHSNPKRGIEQIFSILGEEIEKKQRFQDFINRYFPEEMSNYRVMHT